MLRAEGWTIEAAAEEVGVRETQIRQWEDDDREYWVVFVTAHERVFFVTYAQAMAVMRQEMRSDDSLARWRAANSVLRHFAAVRLLETGLREGIELDETMDEPFAEDGEER